MSHGDICSNGEIHGGFGAMIANGLHRGEEERTRRWEEECAASSVAVASATPAPAKATVAPLRASGTKKSPPVAVTKRTYLTKGPYKRQKKAVETVAAPALTAAPAPTPLVGVHGAAARAPAEKKPPPSFLPCPLWRPCPFFLTRPSIHAVFLSRL